MADKPPVIPVAVRTAVSDCLNMLDQTRDSLKESSQATNADPLPSLLEQCKRLVGVSESTVEPIRTIHHFACSGGTLLTKCLACSPNLHVLSEVNPLSTLNPAKGQFAPSDLMRLAEFSNRPVTQEEKIRLFLSGFSTLYQSNVEKGLRMLVRDHAHSHFCVGATVPDRPSLLDLLRRDHRVLSVVTIRHPIDSYLGLRSNGWLHFQPASIDEYVKRYERFLDDYAEHPVFRYEDFVENPDQNLQAICASLGLPFPAGYQDLFMVHSFSGDSGRKSEVITARPRREMSDSVRSDLRQSRPLHALCERLDYDLGI